MNNVEKVVELARKSMWNLCGEVRKSFDKMNEYVDSVWKVFGFHKSMHEFSKWIYTENLFGFSLLGSQFSTVSTEPITTTTKYNIKEVFNGD